MTHLFLQRIDTPSAAKGVLAAVGNVQETILILMILIHVRHEGRCRDTENPTQAVKSE